MVRYDFSGKSVLVTGSSRGMGASILEAFTRSGATGYCHYFNDAEGQNRRDAESLLERLRGENATIYLVEGDVRDFDAVEQIFRTCGERSGRLDILVNNAGILRDRTIRKMSLEEWHAVLQTNLDGVFHCCKLAAEHLNDNGRIINIASIAGIHPFHGQANYAAAKAGVIALTRVLAKELARRRITVNAVAPGVVQTPMLGEIKSEVMAEYEKQIPLGRIGRPEDIANAVLFFATEESDYITGQILPITGGWF